MFRTATLDELRERIDTESAPSPWLEVNQERIDQFAEATGDRQFIHVDPQRAAEGPFGATIAHGFLSLSLLPTLLRKVTVAPEGTVMAINYGLNKLRFLQPVVVGSEVRARAKLLDVNQKGGGRVLLINAVTIEIKGQDRPALATETLTLFILSPKPETP